MGGGSRGKRCGHRVESTGFEAPGWERRGPAVDRVGKPGLQRHEVHLRELHERLCASWLADRSRRHQSRTSADARCQPRSTIRRAVDGGARAELSKFSGEVPAPGRQGAACSTLMAQLGKLAAAAMPEHRAQPRARRHALRSLESDKRSIRNRVPRPSHPFRDVGALSKISITHPMPNRWTTKRGSSRPLLEAEAPRPVCTCAGHAPPGLGRTVREGAAKADFVLL
jgi:hypothetical protein